MKKVETVEKDIYEFDEKKHVHKLNGQNLTGVTTVLGVIAKPMLIQWSANEAVKSVTQKWMPEIAYSKAEIQEILDEARIAHRKKKEDAGALGTDVHADIELLIIEALQGTTGQIEGYRGENVQVAHFVKWAMDNKVKFLGSEDHLYSKEWWVGGICDFLCEIDGELWCGDIKTGGVYSEAFFQTAAYQMMYEEMGLHQNFKGQIILGLLKDGSFIEKRSVSNEENKEAFLAALKLYRIKQKVDKVIL